MIYSMVPFKTHLLERTGSNCSSVQVLQCDIDAEIDLQKLMLILLQMTSCHISLDTSLCHNWVTLPWLLSWASSFTTHSSTQCEVEILQLKEITPSLLTYKHCLPFTLDSSYQAVWNGLPWISKTNTTQYYAITLGWKFLQPSISSKDARFLQ